MQTPHTNCPRGNQIKLNLNLNSTQKGPSRELNLEPSINKSIFDFQFNFNTLFSISTLICQAYIGPRTYAQMG